MIFKNLTAFLFVLLISSITKGEDDISESNPLILTQDDIVNLCGLSSEVPNPHWIFEKSMVSQGFSSDFTLDHFVHIGLFFN